MPTGSDKPLFRSAWLGRGLVLLAMAGVLAVAVLRWSDMEAWLQGSGMAGAAAFAALFVVLTACCFPVSVLGFTAGYVYGPWLGFGILAVGVYASGFLMLMLGRYLLRDFVAGLAGRDRRLAVLSDLAAERALRLNLLARLSPFNYGLVCYTLASGPTRARDYLPGLLATLPSLALQVAVGVLVRRGLDPAGMGPWQLVGTVAGVAALLVLGWQISRMARQAWRQAAGQEGDRS